MIGPFDRYPWNVYRFVETNEIVTLPSGDQIKKIERVIVATCQTYEEALRVRPPEGEGYLITND